MTTTPGRRSTLLALVLLLVMTAWFDHRLWTAMPVLEGDGPQYVYYWLHPELLEAGYDAAGRDYFALLPVHGGHNPLRMVLVALAPLAASLASPITLAVAGNMLLALLCHVAVAAGALLWLRSLGRSVPAALIGASIVSFTGFHLIGVREFNVLYLVSMAAVFPLLWAAARLALDGDAPVRRMSVCALAIGVSLLGGGNVPLFLYLPFVFALPLVVFAWRRSRGRLGAGLGGLLAAVVAGVAIGIPTIVDGLRAVEVQLRQGIAFDSGPGLAFGDLLRTVVLRDWWGLGGVHFHERDVFLGVPALVLAVVGVVRLVPRLAEALRERETSASLDIVVGVVMLLAGVWAVVVLNFERLPAVMQAAIGGFYEAQSIRYPLRFGLLLLVPAAYFASLGFDALAGRAFPVALVLVGVPTLWQIARLPDSGLMQRIPDARLACALSLGAAAIALAALAWRWHATGRGDAQGAAAALAVAAIFASYLVAPIQVTWFTRWFFDRGFAASADASRLALPRVLGLAPRYDRLLASAARQFGEAPPHLNDPRTRLGRVLDTTWTVSWVHAYATGHRYAFLWMEDPAGHVYLRQLYHTARRHPATLTAVLDAAGVRTLVALTPGDNTAFADWRVAHAGSPGLPVALVVPDASPEAFFVPEGRPTRSLPELLEGVRASGTRALRSTVYLACDDGCPPAVGSANGGTAPRAVTPLAGTAGTKRYRVAAGAPGFMVVSIPWHPDWRATVNGAPGSVLRADHAFMAVPLAGTESTVELHLDHRLRYVARSVSALLLITGALILVLDRDRRRAT